MKRHLVISGTERVGALVADVLLAKALRVRATTPERWRAGERGPLAWAYLDLESGEGIEHAFVGVDPVFIALPAQCGNPLEVLAPLVAESKRCKVEKVVLLAPRDGDGNPLPRCEALLKRSGLRHDIVHAEPEDDPREVAAAAALLLTRDGPLVREAPGIARAA